MRFQRLAVGLLALILLTGCGKEGGSLLPKGAEQEVDMEEAQAELEVLFRAVRQVTRLTADSFIANDPQLATKVEPLEQVIDDLKEQLRTRHILRMQQGQCSIEAGFVWSDLLTDLERTSDHCSNIAGCVIDAAHHDLNMHATLDAARRRDPDFREQYQRCAAKYQV